MANFTLPELTLDIKNAFRCPGLQLVPLLISEQSPEDRITHFLWEGVQDGAIELRERMCVPKITACNRTSQLFFGHKGNIFRGGGQNRQLAHSFIMPGNSEIKVPVQCIQKGRWNPQRQKTFFSQGGETTSSSLRFTGKTQKQVWETIHSGATLSGTVSKSQDYTIFRDYLVGTREQASQVEEKIERDNQGVQIARQNRDRAQSILRESKDPLSGQVGIMASIVDPERHEFGTVAIKYCLEIYASPDLYQNVHCDLVASFAVDAALLPGRFHRVETPKIDETTFSRLLESLGNAPWQQKDSVGEECYYELDDARAFGEAVCYKERVIHLMYGNYTLAPFASRQPRQEPKHSEPTGRIPKPKPGPVKNIAGHRLLRFIGQGAMGEIYLAQSPDESEIAIKLLPKNMHYSDAAIKRFEQGARVQMQLNHPNIVRVYQVGRCSVSGRLYMTMEYVKGQTLGELLDSRGAFDERNALVVAGAMAAALKHAWQFRIIHRDLKPDNVLIGKKTIKLIDFGLGKFASDFGMTITGAMMGTPYYMPCEQIRDAKDVDQRADIYALGATLYHMLAGSAPYSEFQQSLEVLQAKLRQDPIPVCELARGVSDKVSRIVEKAMARDRENRYFTPGELLEDLQDALS